MPTKITAAALGLLTTLATFSCTPAIQEQRAGDREAIQREMPLVVEYEDKRSALKQVIGFLATHGVFDKTSGGRLKESMDIEYVYYEASIISLARGNMTEYRNFVHLAEQELDRVRALVSARIEGLQQEEPMESNESHLDPGTTPFHGAAERKIF